MSRYTGWNDRGRGWLADWHARGQRRDPFALGWRPPKPRRDPWQIRVRKWIKRKIKGLTHG
jgi:hypothetical protein